MSIAKSLILQTVPLLDKGSGTPTMKSMQPAFADIQLESSRTFFVLAEYIIFSTYHYSNYSYSSACLGNKLSRFSNLSSSVVSAESYEALKSLSLKSRNNLIVSRPELRDHVLFEACILSIP